MLEVMGPIFNEAVRRSVGAFVGRGRTFRKREPARGGRPRQLIARFQEYTRPSICSTVDSARHGAMPGRLFANDKRHHRQRSPYVGTRSPFRAAFVCYSLSSLLLFSRTLDVHAYGCSPRHTESEGRRNPFARFAESVVVIGARGAPR